jgi:hypothetical protein
MLCDGSCQNKSYLSLSLTLLFTYKYMYYMCCYSSFLAFGTKVINLMLLNNSLMSFQNLCFVCSRMQKKIYVNEICCFMYIFCPFSLTRIVSYCVHISVLCRHSLHCRFSFAKIETIVMCINSLAIVL